MQVVFVHPDLGIGGAERLVVDAALAMKSKDHRVSFLTSHHDRRHCFDETKDGTFSVTTVGDWIPRKIFGGFHALLAYVKMIYLAFYLIFVSTIQPDVIFCDQISVCVPLLRWGTSAKVVFYCHFPDKLLTRRDSFIKWLYRKPLDWMEERTTGMAHLLLVNSHFTAKVFRNAFPSLSKLETHVLHPTLNTSKFDRALGGSLKLNPSTIPATASTIFLSINRFEKKKNIRLAVLALNDLRDKINCKEWYKVHLVIAGGYDERVMENVSYHKELIRLVDTLDLKDKVTFRRSVDTTEKMALLKASTAVLYTPENEHFGIVPVEAMYTQTPVIAVNSGGPRETIVHEETGFLCDGNPKSFCDAMLRLVNNPDVVTRMGKAGKLRVRASFSFEEFATTLNGILQSILT